MNNTYTILPFRFARFNEDEYLLSNDVGEYIFLQNDDFQKFVNGELAPTSDLFYDIESKQIATTDNVEDVVKMLATKFRTKKSILEDFTSLHMVVPTLRCNSSCIYCKRQSGRNQEAYIGNFISASCAARAFPARRMVCALSFHRIPRTPIHLHGLWLQCRRRGRLPHH